MGGHSGGAERGLGTISSANEINTQACENLALFAAMLCCFLISPVPAPASGSDGVLRSPPGGMRELHN